MLFEALHVMRAFQDRDGITHVLRLGSQIQIFNYNCRKWRSVNRLPRSWNI